MKNYKSKLKIFTFYIVILIFTFLFLHFTSAQTPPQFLISWQAQSYAPSWYSGKILPINGAPIEISFELIDNAKIADLSKTKVRWYVNDGLVKNEEDGLGIKSLKITTPDYAGRESEIRISIVDYRGGELLDKVIIIPVANPEVVIEASYPNREIGVGTSNFRLIPFFFNIKKLDNLSVEWLANGQKSEGLTGNPYLLNLNIGPETPKDTEINLSVSAKSLLKELEFATKSINLVIK